MYIIHITVNQDLPAEQHETMFLQHTTWFKKYFDAGKFLMLGPYSDTDEHAGVIFAQTENRAELDAILAENCYYPHAAKYEIREFVPKLISRDIVSAQ